MSSSKGMAAVTTRVFAGIMLIHIKLLSLPLSPPSLSPLSLPPSLSLSPSLPLSLSLSLSLSLFLLLLKSIWIVNIYIWRNIPWLLWQSLSETAELPWAGNVF